MFDFLEGKKTKLVSAMAMAAGAYAVMNGGDPEVAGPLPLPDNFNLYTIISRNETSARESPGARYLNMTRKLFIF